MLERVVATAASGKLQVAIGDMQLGTYSDKIMIVCLVIVIGIGLFSLLVLHLPLHVFVCVAPRFKWYRKTQKHLVRTYSTLYKPKVLYKILTSITSIWFLFWVVLCPLTILSMFSRLPVAASIFIQIPLWLIVLLHFAVKSDYLAWRNKELTARISSLDAHLGGSQNFDGEYERYEMEDRVDEDTDVADDEYSSNINTLQRRTSLDLTYDDDLPTVVNNNTKWLTILNAIRYYPMDILIGIKKHYLIFTGILLVSIVMPLLMVLPTCYTCVTHNPTTVSTALSRMLSPSKFVTSKQAVCEWNSICHVYLTVPEDMSTSMIVNFHSYSKKPTDAYINIREEGSTESTKVSAKFYRMRNIPIQQRYQYYADLTGLKPDTTYHVEGPFVTVHGKKLKRKQNQIVKFRTAPSFSSDAPINFISGGDTSWSASGIALSKHAALENPLFAIVGGDIAYENGAASCFFRFDDYFYNWNKYMTTANNYSIPILTAIGNHEAGGFRRKRSDANFYFDYFPHQIGLTPEKRTSYHQHFFGKHTYVAVLDSYVVTPITGQQTEWLEDTLEDIEDRLTNRFGLYHAAAYPVIASELKQITVNIRKNFVPLFEEYKFKAVFENHYHALAESLPIKNGETVEEQGVTYLGAGAWGVKPRGDLATNAWWAKHIASYAHIYSVNCTADAGCTTQSIIYDPKSANTTLFSTTHLR